MIFRNPRFYERGTDDVLVAGDPERAFLERAFLNKATGKITPAVGAGGKVTASRPPFLEMQGLVAFDTTKGCEIWIGFRCYRPFLVLRNLQIYKEHKDLKETITMIARAATDLNVGDEFDWIRGHSSLEGDGMIEALEFLIPAVSNTDPDIRLIAGRALFELASHIDHGCFTRRALDKLQEAIEKLKKARRRETSREVRAQFEKTVKEYDRALKKS